MIKEVRALNIKGWNLGVGGSVRPPQSRISVCFALFFSRVEIFFAVIAASESDIKADVHLRFISRALRAVPHPSFREKQNPTGPMLLKKKEKLLRMRSNLITYYFG